MVSLVLRALGFGVIIFGFSFVLCIFLKPFVEKKAWYRKLRIMFMPADFKESKCINEKSKKRVKDEVAAELGSIKEAEDFTRSKFGKKKQCKTPKKEEAEEEDHAQEEVLEAEEGKEGKRKDKSKLKEFLKNKGGKTDGTRTGVGGEEGQARKFYAGKSKGGRVKRKFFGRRGKGRKSGGTCELSND